MINKHSISDILIADPNPDRLILIKEIIEDNFLGNVYSFQAFETLERDISSHNPRLVIIAHDLPNRLNHALVNLSYYFLDLNKRLEKGNSRFRLACLTPNEQEEDMERSLVAIPPYIHVPSLPIKNRDRKEIIGALASLLPRRPKAPEIRPDDNPSLREQIRAISAKRELVEGKKILSDIAGLFWNCEHVKVKSLGQGLSGANVFRLKPETVDGGMGEFVLKMSQTDDFWKLEQEVKRYEKAKQTLGIENYKKHYAEIVEPVLEGDHKYIVNHPSGWWAICYDFLGGERFGKFIDLETAVVADTNTIIDKLHNTHFQIEHVNHRIVEARRIQIWEISLDWLRKNWYQKPGFVKRKILKVWDNQNSPENQYITLPPYQLSSKSKGFIMNFLDSKAASLGERLLFPDWKEHHSRVWSFVEQTGSATQVPLLDSSIPFILAPAHGDLNANNLLLWLEEANHPFLIDFPFFQFKGHALQDFARLEVEIKLSLMDKQVDSDALPALDYTYSQIYPWIEMEKHLQSPHWKNNKNAWKTDGFHENVKNCLRLIQLVRAQAFAVQSQSLVGPLPGDFLCEYLPALLFHTIRAIGYPSLSIFKRLFAIYSTSSILKSGTLAKFV